MRSAAWSKIVNVALYQTGWFCCVLGAAWGKPLLGAGIALALVLLHIFFADNRTVELKLVLSTCLVGVLVDSFQQAAGLFTFKSDPRWPLWLPLWVFVIWGQFATLLRFGLHWLAGRYLLASLFGFVGGPLAYWSGIRLGAAEFSHSPILVLGVLGLSWSLVMPLLLWLREKISSCEGHYFYRFSEVTR